MQSSNNSSRGYPYQSTQQSSSTSPLPAMSTPTPRPQDTLPIRRAPAMATPRLVGTKSTNPQYMHQQYAQGGQPAAGAPLGSGVPPQYQGYPHLDRGGPVVPSQLHAQGTSSPHSYTYPRHSPTEPNMPTIPMPPLLVEH
ncbi:hypothetical protein BC834DRAFT_842123 [Gloeopeniophorella convolvens]|nr:hypothetical protein BC834DRAFT_842123 [Gloeopeniophorella convolvens]